MTLLHSILKLQKILEQNNKANDCYQINSKVIAFFIFVIFYGSIWSTTNLILLFPSLP